MDGDQVIKTLKVTGKNQLRVLSFHIIGTLMMIVTLAFLNFDLLMAIVFLCCWIIYTIPVIYLHLEYLYINRDQELLIQGNKITIRENDSETSYKSEEIERIIICKSASLDKGGMPILSLESYFYIKVQFKSKHEEIFTCLLSNDIDQELKKLQGVVFERRKKLFCHLGIVSNCLS